MSSSCACPWAGIKFVCDTLSSNEKFVSWVLFSLHHCCFLVSGFIGVTDFCKGLHNSWPVSGLSFSAEFCGACNIYLSLTTNDVFWNTRCCKWWAYKNWFYQLFLKCRTIGLGHLVSSLWRTLWKGHYLSWIFLSFQEHPYYKNLWQSSQQLFQVNILIYVVRRHVRYTTRYLSLVGERWALFICNNSVFLWSDESFCWL